ncbi:MAG: prepilin-type N-terminal cleavage/methylation domain-containing protein [Gammaproteobacteria bacterium]|nr:MAG: prepilin-type N-terminal cleavage/methylation domain-containing protein [Gammaproteobacteria bacterium]
MLIINKKGFTLIEMLVAMVIAALLIAAMDGVIGQALEANSATQTRNDSVQAADYAMQRMTKAVTSTRKLLIPLGDNVVTTYRENVREQTIPASPPETGSTLATAVLAVSLPLDSDLDSNGVPDADNDNDGRYDEDLPADSQKDGKAGIRDFDDDGNGTKDFIFSPAGDDDESNDLAQSEDPINGMDDDGDGSIDEDSSADMNGDGAPGVVGVDDDGDTQVDEGDVNDDDEDGNVDEDWLDPLVYYLNNGALIERIAVPWDANTSGTVDGRDYVESTIAENVTLLRFERVPMSAGDRAQLVDITLELSPPDGEVVSLNARVRVGAAQ